MRKNERMSPTWSETKWLYTKYLHKYILFVIINGYDFQQGRLNGRFSDVNTNKIESLAGIRQPPLLLHVFRQFLVNHGEICLLTYESYISNEHV